MKQAIVFFILVLLSAGFAFGGTIVMTTSDYFSGNTAVYDTQSGILRDDILPHFQDAYVKTDDTYMYILEAGDNSSVIKVNPDNIDTPIYQYSVGPGSNPHDMVFLDSKAYVLRYNATEIWVVNHNTATEDGFKLGEIDIAQWADDDGSPDARMGFVYDNLVYIVLQRYNMSTSSADTSVIIAIDPSSDTIIDMDEDVDGIQGVDLIIKNPYKGCLVGSLLYLAGTCYGVSDEGVMIVDLTDVKDSQRKLISEETVGGNVAGVDVFGTDYGLVYSYDENWNTVARMFDPRTGALGRLLPVPDAGGGVVAVGGNLYVGSRHYESPGLFIVDPLTNQLIGEPFIMSLPPYSIEYIGGESRVPVEYDSNVPVEIGITAAYPNPFNPLITIRYDIAHDSHVTLDVFNAAGQKVETLVDRNTQAGNFSMVWNADNLASGVYHVRLSDGVSTKSHTVTLVK